MWMMPLDAPASESTARSRWRNLRRRPRPGDFESGHIPGAKNLSVATRLSKETLATVAGKDDEVVFSCFGKHCPYSAYASAKALLWGYTHVDRFARGFAAWQDGGYPPKPVQRNKPRLLELQRFGSRDTAPTVSEVRMSALGHQR